MGKKKVIEVTDPHTGNPVPVTLETIHVGEKSFTGYRHGRVFVQYPPPDKRKMTEAQVKRYTAEREAVLAMVEAYTSHPPRPISRWRAGTPWHPVNDVRRSNGERWTGTATNSPWRKTRSACWSRSATCC